MSANAGKTVAEILKGKKASIKQAALDPGSPSWDEIMHLTWEEIHDRAKRRVPGYKTFKKLLSSGEYDK
ncbi:MAG: hypothetical protein L0Z62_32195 [Gemmataceae bacterium]|nr:hypothetical protein [Gemmataceae bacterium]